MQSVPITTKVVSSNHAHDNTLYIINYYINSSKHQMSTQQDKNSIDKYSRLI